MDVTRIQFTNCEAETVPGRGPSNRFAHFREFPSADFKTVVRPNFDTLYSSCWLDLRDEPIIVHAPDTAGRYYLLPMLDMWTDVFAVPGKRTTGTGEADFLVSAPGWSGQIPDGVFAISAPTPHVWVIGRTQTNGSADFAAVHTVQDGFTTTPLSQWGQNDYAPPTPVFDDTVDMTTPPIQLVDALSAIEFFTYAAELLRVHPTHSTDFSVLARIAALGIVPGMKFDATGYSETQRASLELGAGDARRDLC